MTVRGIVSGKLHKEPQRRQSANGNPYLLFNIREGNGDATRWWMAICFAEDAIEVVERLQPNDPIAVAGEIDAELYAPDGGKPRVSWKITAETVLTARKPEKREPRQRREIPSR